MKEETAIQQKKTQAKPILEIIYLVFKKTIKYSFYLALIYFAYEGFMAWK